MAREGRGKRTDPPRFKSPFASQEPRGPRQATASWSLLLICTMGTVASCLLGVRGEDSDWETEAQRGKGPCPGSQGEVAQPWAGLLSNSTFKAGRWRTRIPGLQTQNQLTSKLEREGTPNSGKGRLQKPMGPFLGGQL